MQTEQLREPDAATMINREGIESLISKAQGYLPKENKKVVEDKDGNLSVTEEIIRPDKIEYTQEELADLTFFFLRGESRIKQLFSHSLFPDYGGWSKKDIGDVMHIFHNMSRTYYGLGEIPNPYALHKKEMMSKLKKEMEEKQAIERKKWWKPKNWVRKIKEFWRNA